MPLSRSELDDMNSASRVIHAGREIDLGKAVPTAPAIHVATAYTYPTSDELDDIFVDNSRGYVYSRMGNPTVRALEQAIAATEGTEEGIAYASGMAAIHGVISGLAKAGDRVIASRDVYGATHSVLNGYFSEFGVESILVDMADLDEVERMARELKPTLIYTETISNPLIKVVDLRRLADIAHANGATFAVDNTFASPIVTRAADLGADVVLYSSTKHLGGHGDTTGGLVATNSGIAGKLRDQLKLVGAVASPFDAWLVLRGLRTLDLRVRKQSDNACQVAAWLARDQRVDTVYYPGQTGRLPAGQFQDNLMGTMLAFEIRGASTGDVFRFQDALRMIQPAPTLGDVHTIVLHPATTSQRGLTPDDRERFGIRDGLVRLSAGIEYPNDIIADLDQALTVAVR
jgi:cystathionine gamma-synthase/methionine-gamma-lyase